jgi:hypothetical protein
MPSETDDAPVVSTRNWGKVDKAALRKLVIDGDVNIDDLSYNNIDAVHEKYFPHRTVRNFLRNFREYSSAFDLERELSGPRRAAQAPSDKMCCFIIINACV